MPLRTYNSIENSYNKKFLEKILKVEDVLEIDWVATEKIHGTNFSIYKELESDKLVYCKRSGKIDDSDKFYDYKKTMKRLDPILQLTFQYILDNYKVSTDIQIFGELFGGNYPIDGVKSLGKIIQKGVYYSNDNHFKAFDISIDGKFIDYNEFEKIVLATGLPTVPVLKIGKLLELLDMSPEFETKIYLEYGLPEIKNNISEGFVIKSIKSLPYHDRLILKVKSSKFTEVPKVRKDNLETIEKIWLFINKNRVDSVKSKYSEDINEKKLTRLVVLDAIEEYEKLNLPVPELGKGDIISKLIGKLTKTPEYF